MKKKIALLLSLALMLTMAACGQNNVAPGNNTGNTSPDTSDTSSEPKIIRVGADMSAINNLDVWITTYSNIYEISDLIFDRLLEKDPETLEVYPSLLTSMPEVSDDGLVYTFELKEGIKFHMAAT